MNIIDKLKSLGVEVTEEIEKAFPGEFVSALEVEKKTEKINTLEQDKETLIKEQANLDCLTKAARAAWMRTHSIPRSTS